MKRAVLIALVLGLAACKVKPTYTADNLASELKKMVAHDYKMDIETRLVGTNLQSLFWRVGLFKGNQLEMQSEAADALERMLLSATRISLSTEAPLDFLEVKMIDGLTGATVTLWRFVPDIRDSMYTRLAEEEYINRLVVDFQTEAPNNEQRWKEMTWDKPITMQEFLAKQVVLRVKRQSLVGIQAHEDLSQPETLAVVVDNWSTIKTQGETEEQKVTELVESTIRTVMSGYRYKGFRDFVVKNSQGAALKRWAL